MSRTDSFKALRYPMAIADDLYKASMGYRTYRGSNTAARLDALAVEWLAARGVQAVIGNPSAAEVAELIGMHQMERHNG